MGPFEESVEFGTAHTGQTIGRAQYRAGGVVADDDDAGLFAGGKLKAMNGKAGAEIVTIPAIGPCGADMPPHRGEVYALPFCGLMTITGKGRFRFRAVAQRTGQTVGQIALAFTAQRGQHRQIMRPCNDGMAELQFQQAGDFLMPRMVEPG